MKGSSKSIGGGLATAVMLLASAAAMIPAKAAAVPYQRSVLSNCTNGAGLKVCRYRFAKVAPKHRLDIQFVNCAVETQKADPAYLSAASLGVNDGFNFPQIHLAWQSRETDQKIALTISQPVVFSISAGNAAQIAFEFDGTLSARLSCGISGELVTVN